jgi:LuxR family maltose regulon positive regulatory protein
MRADVRPVSLLASLVATKLYLPPARLNRVPRPRLMARLNENRPLTLIVAPAGFGKTTLLSEWIPQNQHCITWVSLDDGDNDPIRLWAYIIAALKRLRADFGESALALLHASRPQPPPVTAILTMLINEIAAFPDSFSLVLDDYHVITAQPIHEALDFLVGHLPPQLRLVITSRADLPLPLARYRARDQLTELRAADLRFTADEAAAFLNQVMALKLATDDIAVLETRTEGWIAGLQLAALSIQGRDAERSAQFIRGFSGSHHYIMDYLVEEVLQRQPERVQAFLLQTSILDRLNGPLSEVVTGQADSQTMLEQLERANLFLVPLDEEGRWYRYHHLFGDLLRYRLQRAQPDQVSDLHRRASDWYESNGWVAEAIQHALAAQDFERVARLVEQAGDAMWMRGEVRTLLRWLDGLPDAVVRARERLCLLHAWLWVLEGQLRQAQRRWQDADTALRPGSAEEQGKLAAIGAAIAYLRGDPARSLALSQQALQLLPPDSSIWRGVTALHLGIGHRMAGDIKTATHYFAEAMAINRAADNWHATLLAQIDLADTYEIQGQLRRAAELYQAALDSATERGADRLPLMAETHVRMGALSYEWNDLAAAARHLATGIELAQHLDNVLAQACLAYARVLLAQADAPGALTLIQKAEPLMRSPNATIRTVVDVEAGRIRVWLAQGNIAAATDWARQYRARVEDERERSTAAPAWHEVLQVTLARVLLAQHRWPEAQRLLEGLLEVAEASGRTGHVIEMQVLRSIALQAYGDSASAIVALERALLPAKAAGYIRTFVDEGEPIRSLLVALRARRKSSSLGAYTEMLLTAFGQFAGPAVDGQPSSLLVEPLSARELEVLRLIAAGASNQEIARQCVVAISTIKTHINSLYGKLGVKNRIQAVGRAKALKLL